MSRSRRLGSWLSSQATRLGLTAQQVFENFLDNADYLRVARLSAPVNTEAPAITGTPTEGETLTVDPGEWTGDPTPELTIQWERDGVAIAGETETTYLLVLADVGAEITVTVTASNAIDETTETSAPTATVAAA